MTTTLWHARDNYAQRTKDYDEAVVGVIQVELPLAIIVPILLRVPKDRLRRDRSPLAHPIEIARQSN